MTNQANALRKLDNILNEAINNGNQQQPAGPILLRAMELEETAHNLTNFYAVLTKAKNEAQRIRNKPKLDRYLKIIEDLHGIFIIHHLWSTPWQTFSMYIEGANILTALDSLADDFDRQNPSIFLKKDFIEKMDDDFTDLLKQVSESDLSQEFKNFLINQLERILTAIRQYDIDGGKDLENASKSFMSDLLIIEPRLLKEDKDNLVYRRVMVKTFGVVLSITPYLISIYPDINTFWIPKLEELISQDKQPAEDGSNIQRIISQALSDFNQETPEAIESKKIKTIESSKK